MRTFLRAVLTIPADTAIPEDAVQMRFHFRRKVSSNAPDLGVAEACRDAIRSGLNQVTEFLSNDLKVSEAFVKVYDLEIAPPAGPIAEVECALAPPSGAAPDLPAELALCLSYQAGRASGEVQRRRRGRVYVGPLKDAVQPGATLRRPSSALVSAVANMGGAILTAAQARGWVEWSVFSPTTAGGWALPGQSGPPNFGAAFHAVDNGWVDNAWDVQRRRGIEASYRELWS